MKSRLKSLLGKLGLIAGALVLVLLAELLLRVSGFGNEYQFILRGHDAHSGKACLNSQYIAVHYFNHLSVDLAGLLKSNPWFDDTEFSAEKKSGAYRIMLVGASTTRGFPFEGRTISYARFLELILKDVLPGRPVEVVNAGYDALSSFGVLDLTRQLLDYTPDLLVVYTGHNEFIGHFGGNSTVNFGQNRWVIDLVTRLHATRLFLAGELTALRIQSSSRQVADHQGRVNLFREMLSQEHITWDEALHTQTLINYRENLRQLVHTARDAGTEVILTTPVSNVRDFPPIRSELSPQLTSRQAQAFEAHMLQGQSALDGQKWAEAQNAFEKALALDSNYAAAWFHLGQVNEHQQEYDRARHAYTLARDLDKVHLRACGEMLEWVRRIGREEQVPVLDLERVFERASPNGLMGGSLFLEHVHPNVNGHLIIADAMSRFLAKSTRLAVSKQWDFSRLRPAKEYVQASGYNARQFFQSRYTVARLLLDFPFYQCDSGAALLKELERDQEETALIRQCYKKRSDTI